MAYSFWLQDEDSNQYIIDTNIQEMSISGYSRNFKVYENTGAPGASVRGFGVVGDRKFTISHREKIETGDMNFWNSRRDALLTWINKPIYISQWLYVRNGEDTRTVRSRCYPSKIGADKFNHILITDMKSFEFMLPEGVFENVSSTTDTESVVDNTEHEFTITNNGSWECPVIFSFTPTGTELFFQVILSDTFGFRLQGNFIAGTKVSYDTADGTMTIGGQSVDPTLYLTAGSVFNLPSGSQSVYVTCSGAGTFEYLFNELYV